jgi:hypothetical protein
MIAHIELGNQLRKPNLFLVGFPKTGTTALWKMLSRHTQIYVPPVNEIHYFEVNYKNLPYQGPGDMTDPPIKTEEEYLDLFRGRQERYLMDYTPAYAEHPEVASDIKVFNSDAKILILLRNPVERCFSNYCHQVRKGHEKRSFEDALRIEEERRSLNWGMFWRYKENSYYYSRTKAYFDAFDVTNVKTVLTQELQNDTITVLEDLIHWLDLDWENIASFDRHNRSGKPNWKLKLLDRMRSIALVRNVGRRFVSAEAVQKFRNDNLESIDLSEKTRNELRQLFTDDIKKLERLINKDLSTWYE